MAKESKGSGGKGTSNPGKSDSGQVQNKETGKLNERKIPDFKFTPEPPPPPPKDSSKSDDK